MFFSSIFSIPPCIVLDMATLTKHCKTRIETNFFVFLFFVFFGKSWSKIQAKKRIKNMSKNVVPGTPLGRQNDQKWDQGSPEVRPKSKK